MTIIFAIVAFIFGIPLLRLIGQILAVILSQSFNILGILLICGLFLLAFSITGPFGIILGLIGTSLFVSCK